MGVQGWWGNLFQGGISVVVGGMVAALTAWFVVTAGTRSRYGGPPTEAYGGARVGNQGTQC
jgi:hypothetical protein